jgi:hypothetical protein
LPQAAKINRPNRMDSGAEAPDNKTELKLRTPRHRVRCGNTLMTANSAIVFSGRIRMSELKAGARNREDA